MAQHPPPFGRLLRTFFLTPTSWSDDLDFAVHHAACLLFGMFSVLFLLFAFAYHQFASPEGILSLTGLLQLTPSFLKRLHRTRRHGASLLLATPVPQELSCKLLAHSFARPSVLVLNLDVLRQEIVPSADLHANASETFRALLEGTLELDGFKIEFPKIESLNHTILDMVSSMGEWYAGTPSLYLQPALDDRTPSVYTLDSLPLAYLPEHLSVFVALIPFRSSSTLHFTSKGPSYNSADSAIQVAARLALRRSLDYRRAEPSPKPRPPTTYLPLAITAASVTSILSSSCPGIKLGLEDVSARYVESLDSHVRTLTAELELESGEGQGNSSATMDERFLTIWRMAVVKAGLLTRWELVVRPKDEGV
ncbi:hypothetical protein EIP91_008994 [Steccherinum ochraceum]|uniref:Uncharacterized protein n=1 Tax=Steccherinum ochraceum TaxID=92696 RepID=A0A4R0RAD5_9APHY|nr:hypothetical protein EIP91_008994 [Steccherinum ochraceum]